jgi:hypothetical protein
MATRWRTTLNKRASLPCRVQHAEAARQDTIRRFCGLALQGIDHLAPKGRQRLLRALLDEIVVRAEVLEIHGILPGRWTPSVRTGTAWSSSSFAIGPERGARVLWRPRPRPMPRHPSARRSGPQDRARPPPALSTRPGLR